MDIRFNLFDFIADDVHDDIGIQRYIDILNRERAREGRKDSDEPRNDIAVDENTNNNQCRVNNKTGYILFHIAVFGNDATYNIKPAG